MSGHRIMIVEDEAVLRMDLQERLEGLGYRVVGACDTAAESVALAGQLEPDLILMDIRLRGRADGIEAAREIRRTSRIPVVFLTAFADDETVLRARLTEPFGYLHKPCQDRDLRTAIEIGLYKHSSEERVHRSEQHYAAMVESIGDGIISIDSMGRVTLMNPAAEGMTGWDAKDALGVEIEEVLPLFHERTKDEVFNSARIALATGRSAAMSAGTILRSRTGREIPLEDSAAPIPAAPDGPRTGAVLTFRDISERREAEDQFLQAQKLHSLGLMAGGIAHDFNNILTSILGFTGMLREHLPPAGEAAGMLGHIELAARRAADLTSQMLAYAGGRKVSHVPVDLSAAVRDTVALLSATVPGGTLFELDLDDNLPAVLGDPGQMLQVAMNLLTNAAESLGGNPGRVAATTKVQYLESIELQSPFLPGELPPGNYCCLEVIDAGSGMSGRTVERIFDPFFTTKSSGRGLGLSAVLGIVRSHRGTLHVRSTPGRGTRFEVCLPSTGQPSARPVPETRAAPPTPRGKILVIDDDPGICALVRTILTRDGWESEEHLDPRSVVAMTATHLAGFSAVILDVTMPEIDGYEVLRAIRTLCPGLPVMIVSGRSAGELESLIAASGSGSGSGADATMQKPFEAHSLSEAISRLTQTRRG